MTKDVVEAQWEVYKFKIEQELLVFLFYCCRDKNLKHVVVQLITDQSFQFD